MAEPRRDISPRVPVTTTIRNATARDIASVLELWRDSGSVPTVSDSPEALGGLLERSPDALLLAETGDEIVGSLIVGWDGWRGSFYRLAVRTGHRRRGIAAALVEEGERRLRDAGARRFTAIVVDDDPVAMGFWRGIGYDQQSNRARFVRNP
jgi:ribosomal protein S18 acetylase RimI-like enzyme